MNGAEDITVQQRWLNFQAVCAVEAGAVAPELVVARSYSPYDVIRRELRIPQMVQPPKILLSGLMGSGKSTELLKLARDLSDKFVVYMDIDRVLTKVFGDAEAINRIESWEIAFLLGIQTFANAQSSLGTEVVADDLLEDLEQAWKKATRTEDPAPLRLLPLAKALANGASVLMAVSAAPVAATVMTVGTQVAEAIATLGVKVGLKHGERLGAQSEEVTTMLRAVNRVFNVIATKHKQVVVILDGLDRVQNDERIKTLFVESDLMAKLDAAVVLCAPFAPHGHGGVAAIRGFRVHRLLCEPVVDPKTISPTIIANSTGINVLRNVYLTRAKSVGLNGGIPDSLLDRLALNSGGRLRDFVKLLNEIASEAYHANVKVVDEDLVDRVLTAHRKNVEESLFKEDYELLGKIMLDPLHELLDRDRAAGLLRDQKLMVYPNESEWFFPHPMLSRKLSQRQL
ncbi:MAG: P-loop NTPase fold protein [Deltaproteobacteria bacterium]|nr:P-loop NTPase fold protein [Deltaproteobacteria bacterium]